MMFSFYSFFTLQTSILLTSVELSIGKISFCDGDNLFVINNNECPGSLYFGNRTPSCVCVSGVYRSWTKDCQGFDSFTQNYCFPSIDQHDDANSILGLKLISDMDNFPNETFAIVSENKSDLNYKSVGIGKTGNVSSRSFYTINGFATVLIKPNHEFICVEPSFTQDLGICQYFQYDNEGVWIKDDLINVQVMSNCAIPGYTTAKLKEQRCNNLMAGKDCNRESH